MKDLKDIMKMKKSEPKMGDDEKQAKKEMLVDLIKHMDSMMGENIKGLKKVTVASNDKQGLEKGLEKAKEMVSDKDIEQPSLDDTEHNEENIEGNDDDEILSRDAQDGNCDEDEMSHEEIDRQIQALQEKKNRKQGM